MWFKSMRTLFGRLKKKKSGQAVKPMTARQVWTLRCFKFLEAHLTIQTDTRQLGKVVVPVEVKEEEEEEEEEMMPMPPVHAALARQPVVRSPACLRPAPVKAHDRRPKAATSTKHWQEG